METLRALGRSMEIYVEKPHAFGTDSVLLARFASPDAKEAAVDLGAGCGIIPLLWCLWGAPREIHAVELQASAVELIRKSATRNRLEEVLYVHRADLRALDGILPAGRFDLVTCNPPYGLSGSGRKSPVKERRVARHEEQCTFADTVRAAARLLRFGGRFCLCHRPARLPAVLVALTGAGLEPKVLRLCAHRPGKAPFLFLLSACKGGKPFLEVEPTLYIEDAEGNTTEEIRDIYGAYGREGAS